MFLVLADMLNNFFVALLGGYTLEHLSPLSFLFALKCLRITLTNLRQPNLHNILLRVFWAIFKMLVS